MFETLMPHFQIDGKKTNVSFNTSNVSGWKETIFERFGPLIVTHLNDGKVISMLFEANKAIDTTQINLFDTGFVVIQGANCTLFADTFFPILKNKVYYKTVQNYMKSIWQKHKISDLDDANINHNDCCLESCIDIRNTKQLELLVKQYPFNS